MNYESKYNIGQIVYKSSWRDETNRKGPKIATLRISAITFSENSPEQVLARYTCHEVNILGYPETASALEWDISLYETIEQAETKLYSAAASEHANRTTSIETAHADSFRRTVAFHKQERGE